LNSLRKISRGTCPEYIEGLEMTLKFVYPEQKLINQLNMPQNIMPKYPVTRQNAFIQVSDCIILKKFLTVFN
jgi:hypothetical protein